MITNIMKFEPDDVLVMGRSIGSGPATLFASVNPCGALVLISPFTSLKCVAKYNFGSIVSTLLNQRFENEAAILKVKCPCLFIHGKEDTLIPYEHSKTLYSTHYLLDLCPQPAEVLIFSGMTHQYFDINECIAMPSMKFFEKIEPTWMRPNTQITVYKHLFMIPEKMKSQLDQSPRSKHVMNSVLFKA